LINYYYSVNIDSAIYFINDALKITQRCKWEGSEIDFLIQLGFAYNVKGNYFQAVEYNYEALLLAEKRKKVDMIYMIQRILGESYLKLEQLQKGRELILKAYQGAKKYKNSTEELAALTDLGQIEQDLKNYSLSEKYFREAVPVALKTKDLHIQGIAYHNLGNVLAKQAKSVEAKQYFDKSLAIHHQENHHYSLANLYNDLAEISFSEKSYQNSINQAEKTIFYAQKSNSPDLISKGNYWLYRNYEVSKTPAKALFHYENYIRLKDSLNKEDFQKRINALQFEYDNVKKNAEISTQKVQILSKNNENLELQRNRNLILGGAIIALFIAGFLYWNRKQLRKINETLEQKVADRTSEISAMNQSLIKKNEEISEALFKGQTIERKRVASELHDNLSSLLSAVKMSLQVIKTDKLSDKEKEIYAGVREMMNNAYQEVRNISHNILPEELERLGLEKTLEKLITKINASEIVEIRFEADLERRLDSKIEFNLYSICLELLNNIIKHSKATKATISLKNQANTTILKVSDNGIGLKNETKEGIGLTNIHARIEAINGKIDIHSKENIGTEVWINVPFL
jgi:signal transduction histidine kinase